MQSFYVDDGTLGADSDEEAEELYRQLNLMLGKGGFPLAKWATNSADIKSLIGTIADSVDLDLCVISHPRNVSLLQLLPVYMIQSVGLPLLLCWEKS